MNNLLKDIKKEIHSKVKEWIDDELQNEQKDAWHYGKLELHRDIDRIFYHIKKRIEEQK